MRDDGDENPSVNPVRSTAESPVSVREGASEQREAERSRQLESDTGREDVAVLYGSNTILHEWFYYPNVFGFPNTLYS